MIKKKKKTAGIISYIAVFIIIGMFVVKTVNFHTDGSLFKDGMYTLYDNTTTYNLDVEKGKMVPGTNIRFYEPSPGENWQRFYIAYDGDGVYYIYCGDGSVCVGASFLSDNVLTQRSVQSEWQKWKIERIGSSELYWITNVYTGKALKIVENEDGSMNAVVAELDKNDESFKIKIKR
jgi:hypothetical protein